MKTSRVLSLILVAGVALLLAACDGGGGGGSAAVSLTQNYSSAGLSFKYPDGWVVGNQAGAAVVANTAIALQRMTAPGSTSGPQAGEVGVSFVPLPAEAVASVDNVSPLVLLQAFLPSLQVDAESPAFGEGAAVTIAGKAAAQATGSNDQYDGRAVVIDLGGSYLLAVLISGKGEIGTWNATVDAILASASYTAPADGGS